MVGGGNPCVFVSFLIIRMEFSSFVLRLVKGLLPFHSIAAFGMNMRRKNIGIEKVLREGESVRRASRSPSLEDSWPDLAS